MSTFYLNPAKMEHAQFAVPGQVDLEGTCHFQLTITTGRERLEGFSAVPAIASLECGETTPLFLSERQNT